MLEFFNRNRPESRLELHTGAQVIPATPLTIRMRHIDIELSKLSVVRPRTETTWDALDFWLDRRLTLRGGEGGS